MYDGLTRQQIWASFAGEREDDGFTHVKTLYRQQEALEGQRDNLRRLRERLAEAWPPERSEAAAAFHQQLNEMIEASAHTARAAGAVCAGVDEIYAAIREARRALAATAESGPAADEQARRILVAADARIAAASELVRTAVPTYDRYRVADTAFDETTGPAGTAGGGGTGGGSTSASTGGGRLAALRQQLGEQTATGAVPGSGSSFVAIGDPDNVRLAGGGATDVPAGRPAVDWGPVAVIDGTSAVPNRVWTGRPPAPVPGDVQGLVIGAPAKASSPGAAVTKPAAEGNLMPGTGLAAHQNPAAAGRRGAKSRAGDGQEEWTVKQGVPPVIEPPPARDHDPGPGVLGIDR